VAKKSTSTNAFNIQSEIWSGTNPIDTHQPVQQLPLPLPQQVPHDDHPDLPNQLVKLDSRNAQPSGEMKYSQREIYLFIYWQKTVGRPTKECSKQPPYTVTIDNELIARTLIELANDGIDDEEWDDDFLEYMNVVYGCNKELIHRQKSIQTTTICWQRACRANTN
jgi:hypothetical protein